MSRILAAVAAAGLLAIAIVAIAAPAVFGDPTRAVGFVALCLAILATALWPWPAPPSP